MDRTLSDKLHMMAVLWDELAVRNSAVLFQQQFLPDLELLDGFQRKFPDKCPAALITLLELKVLRYLKQQFTKSEILQLRAHLNQSN